jgi:hypothetical protein
MAVPRPMLLALIAALLLAATFQVTVAARSRTSEPAPAQQADAAPKPPPRPKAQERPPARPKPRERPRPARRPSSGLPPAVDRALAARQALVLFFFEPGGADDGATAAAVDSLRGAPGVAVFSAPIERLASYYRVIGDAEVTQAPAIVIVGRDRRARVVEGFVDEQTLAQEVADAR